MWLISILLPWRCLNSLWVWGDDVREIIGLTEKKMDSYLVAGRLGYVSWNSWCWFMRVKTDHVNTSLSSSYLHTFATSSLGFLAYMCNPESDTVWMNPLRIQSIYEVRLSTKTGAKTMVIDISQRIPSHPSKPKNSPTKGMCQNGGKKGFRSWDWHLTAGYVGGTLLWRPFGTRRPGRAPFFAGRCLEGSHETPRLLSGISGYLGWWNRKGHCLA